MSTQSTSSTGAQDSAIERANLHRALARTLPDMGILFFDHDLRYFMVEGEALASQGFHPEEMEGRTLYEVLPEGESREQLVAAYRQALAGQKVIYDTTYNGRYYSTEIVPVRDDAGKIFAGMVVARDITQQKQTESVLIENAQRLSGLFDRSNDAIFFLDLDGTISGCNAKACAMLGYEEEDLVGTRPTQYIVGTNVERSQAETVALIRGENIPNYVRRFRRADGTQFYGEVSSALIRDGDDNPSHVQSIVRDVTWRVETEETLTARVTQLTTLRAVDEELADRLDVDYVATMALDSAMRLTGAAAGFIGLLGNHGKIQVAEIVGDYPVDVAESYLSQGIGVVGQAIATQRAQHAPNTDKEPVYVALRESTGSQIAVPLVSRDTLIGVLNVEDDRTGWFTDEMFDMVKLIASRIATAIDNAQLFRQTESQLKQLRDLYDQLSDLEQLKSDMIRIASHDLRNPLSAVQGYIQLMEMDLPSLPDDLRASFEDYVKQMSGSAKHMEEIINDILSLERIQEQGHTEFAPFDFSGLVQDVVGGSDGYARLGKVTLRLTLPDDPIIVNGDSIHLREALDNLVGNAIKYTPANGTVDVRVRVNDSYYMVLDVVDNGVGIPEEAVDKLFQPFFRAENVRGSMEGTGLGLYLVKKIVDRHDGSISLVSEIDKGTTFTVRLPITFDV